MHRSLRRSLCLLAAGGLVVAGVGVSGTAVASPDDGHQAPTKVAAQSTVHDLPDPKEDKRRALREEAISQVLHGQAKVRTRNGSKVVRLSGGVAPKRVSKGKAAAAAPEAKDQYVELQRERTDKIFVVLAEFGNERHPSYPDKDTDPNTAGPTTFDGPLHNQIPAPDRSADNSTIWQADYSPDHYRELYFGTGAGVESLRTYYQKQSSGRYSVDGEVTDWVKVRYNEARYGRSNGYPCSGNVCGNSSSSSATPSTSGWPTRRPPEPPTPRSKPSCSPSTHGTATTTTATATSTSQMATSTTSRSCTPAATRPTATPTRVRTPSGPTVRRLRSRPTVKVPPTTPTAVRRSDPPVCGWPTTRCSPRTVVCRSSRTSTATTWDFPTSMTPPPPATTQSAGGH